jgi:protein-disulfide isomerase
MSNKKITRAERRQKIKRQKQMQSIGIMILGVLIIVGGIVIASFIKPKMAEAPNNNYTMVNGNSIGDPDAPVQIEVFSSFACIHCRNFAEETGPMIFETYAETGQIYFTYRSLNNPNDPAGIAAQAAYCAGDQGKFWQMHDTIFANFSNTGYSLKGLNAMAENLNLDEDAFNECMETGKYIEQINADAQAGQAVGITGTPSFTLNGQLVAEGNRDYAFFQQQIDTALATANN